VGMTLSSKNKERPRVTVIMPVFNEESTIEIIVKKVLSRPEVKQLIVVDDCSIDGSPEIIESLQRELDFDFLRHSKNKGKGAAIRTAQSVVKGEITLIQDADLEYDPDQYPKLIAPILEDRADVVYGSRFQTGEMRRVVYFWHYVGNKLLTILSNAFSNINLSDMETCYKVVRSDYFEKIQIQESRFGFEPELTAKLAAMRARFYEVSISYYGRTYEEGKKIGAKDGFRAIYCIIRYNLFNRTTKQLARE